MITQPLLDYISQQLKKGTRPEDVKKALVDRGWVLSDVEEGFTKLGISKEIPVASISVRDVTKTTSISEGQGVEQQPQETKAQAKEPEKISPIEKPIVSSPPLEKSPDTKPTVSIPTTTKSEPQSPVLKAEAGLEATQKTEKEKNTRFPTLSENKPVVSGQPDLKVVTTLVKAATVRPKVNFIFLLSTVVAVLLLLAGGGWYVFSSGILVSPKQNIEKMLAKLPSISSFEVTATSTAQFSATGPAEILNQYVDDAGGKFDLSGNLSGAINNSDPSNPKGSATFSLVATTTGNQVLRISGEVRVVGNRYYLKLSELPEILGFDPTFLQEQWLVFNQPDLDGDREATRGGDFSRLLSSISDSDFIEVSSKLADTRLEDISVYHYKYNINKDKFYNFIQTQSAALGGVDSTSKGNLDALKQFLASVKSVGGELYIGKKDLLPYKITIELVVPSADGSEDKYTLDISAKSFNKTIIIDSPAGSKTLEDVFKESSASLVPRPDSEKLVDSDNDGFTNVVEVCVGTEPDLKDTDGDGFSDYEEFRNGYTPFGAGRLSDALSVTIINCMATEK